MTEMKAQGQATILVMDDDADFRLQQRVQLEAVGFTVLEADNRQDAETILNEQKVDVAMVDLMMEEEDTGFQICYHIKKNHPGVGVIIVTGVAAETGIEFDASTDEERAWVKADALLAKPVRNEQLLREIDRIRKG